MSSNGISFYTHLCSISNKVNFSLNAADPCEEENKKDCCSHKSEQRIKEKCCKINFIFFKIKDYPKFGYNPPPNLPLKSRIILYQSFLC